MPPSDFDLSQGAPFGFGDGQQNKEESQQTDGAISPEGEDGADDFAVVEHGKGLGDNIAGGPDGEGGNSHGAAADSIGQDFGAKNPRNRSHRHRERGDEKENANQERNAVLAGAEHPADQTQGNSLHAGPDEQEGLATGFIDKRDCNKSKQQINQPNPNC